MNAESATQLVVVLLCACVVASIGGWARFGRDHLAADRPSSLLARRPLSSPRCSTSSTPTTAGWPRWSSHWPGATAVLGGGPLTTRVFAVVDAQDAAPGRWAAPDGDRRRQVLRGGAWIGALERGAVFASLAVGMPEGVAIVLALKGLGRYAELQSEAGEGAAERFIIGTFTSVLWAGRLRRRPGADPALLSQGERSERCDAERARLVIGSGATRTAKPAKRSERRRGPGAEAHEGIKPVRRLPGSRGHRRRRRRPRAPRRG